MTCAFCTRPAYLRAVDGKPLCGTCYYERFILLKKGKP